MRNIPACVTRPSFFSRGHARGKVGVLAFIAFSFLLVQRHCEEQRRPKSQEMKSKQQFGIKIVSPLVDLNQICSETVLETTANCHPSLKDWRQNFSHFSSSVSLHISASLHLYALLLFPA